MLAWTIQKTSIIDKVSEGVDYQPDFSKSDYIDEYPEIAELYHSVLESFNAHNGSQVPGLVFTFFQFKDGQIQEITSIQEFDALVRKNYPDIASLIDRYQNPESESYDIVALEYPDSINPIFIDINDFQFMIPPRYLVPGFKREDFEIIETNIRRNWYRQSSIPTTIVQGHFSTIKRENIVARYPLSKNNQ